jgi:hypothetical protein
MSLANKSLHVLQGAVGRVYILIVGDVVAHVHLRAVVHRADPDDINSEASYVVKLGDDAWKVSDSVSIGVAK